MEESSPSRRNPLTRFLGFIWNVVRSYLIVVGLLVTLAPLLFFWFLSRGPGDDRLKSAQIAPGEKVVLNIELNGQLAEHVPEVAETLLARLLGDSGLIDSSRIEAALRRATNDKRVVAAMVEINELSGSPAAYSQLRQAFAKFKDSKKPLVFYINAGSSYDYYLASLADELILPPSGDLDLTEPLFQLVYLGSALEKLGIEFEVLKAGKYKSFMEPFVSDAPSVTTMEMYKSLEQSLRSHLIDTVAQSRSRNPDEVRQWFKRSFFTAAEAAKAGLVSQLSYRTAAAEGLKGKVQADNFMKVSEYLAASASVDEPLTDYTGDQIAYIEAMGNIVQDHPNNSTQAVAPRYMIRELQWAARDPSIKAAVLRISSPGGSALAADLIWDEVRKLAEQKPVVVSMGEVAASGGYYIAAPATKILAEPTTITGSIGVIAAVPKGKQFDEKYGIYFHVVSESERRALMNFGASATAEDRAVVGKQVDAVYGMFLQKVADGRKLALEKVQNLAEGRVYTGEQAMKIGLVDQLGGLRDAYQEAKKLANLNPHKLYPVARYRGEPISLWECLRSPGNVLECVNSLDADINLPVSLWTNRMLGPLREVEYLLTQDRVLAYLPGWWPNRLR